MSPDYEHQRLTASKAEQINFFNSFPVVYQTNDFNQIKMQGRGYIDVKSPYANMVQANYLYFVNTNIDPKTYFCFVTDIEIKSNDTTRIYFTRDVFQTWLFDFTIMPSLIDREHVSTSNTRNIIPENIMTGNEYEVVDYDLITPQDNLWFVIACKEQFHNQSSSLSPTQWVGSHPDQLTYYFIPYSTTENDIWINNVQYPYNNISYLLFAFTAGQALSVQTENNIVSMYTTDFLPIDVNGNTFSRLQAVNFNAPGPGGSPVISGFMLNSTYGLNWQTTKNSTVYQDNIITGVDNEKLNYYPFTIIEVTDNRGSAVTYKPEGLQDNRSINLMFAGSIGPNQSTISGLIGYNNEVDFRLVKTRGLFNNNPQDCPILSDYLDAFIQGNKNALENQKQFLEDDNRFNTVTKALGTGISAAAGIGLSMATLNPIPMAMAAQGVMNGAIDIFNQNRKYDQAIANINAKQEDLENRPPSINSASGNFDMIAGNQLLNYTIVVKRVRQQYIDLASNHFKYYGFAVNRFGVPNMNNRQSWNFVKLANANIKGNFYQNDIEQVKNIFEKGVTLWHTNDMMNYNLENGEV